MTAGSATARREDVEVSSLRMELSIGLAELRQMALPIDSAPST